MKLLRADGTESFGQPRKFTQTQWPPTNPYWGEIVLLADTFGGTSFSWAFEYRTDLDASYPWRAAYGLTASAGALLDAGAYTYVGSWTARATINVPLAGYYSFDAYAYCGNANQNGSTPTNNVGWGTSNSGAPPASAAAQCTPASVITSSARDNNELTTTLLTKGQAVYLMGNASPQACAGGAGCYRPIKVAHA